MLEVAPVLLRSDPSVAVDEQALAELARRYGIRELSLFGSVLRDDFAVDSDVDMLVSFQDTSPVRDLLDFIEVQQGLEDLLGRRVDLVEPHVLHPAVRDRVLASRKVIYVAA